jgi:hypothetical protein
MVTCEQTERKPITIPAPADPSSRVVAIAKDWLAGGTAAGLSKTAVAPIGKHVRLHPLAMHPLHWAACGETRAA